MITQLIATTLKSEQLAQQLVDAAKQRNAATAHFVAFKTDLLDLFGPDDDPIVVNGGTVKARSGSPAKRVTDSAKVAQLCPKVASALLAIAEQVRASGETDAADAVVRQAQRLLRLPTKPRKASPATLVVTLR